MNSLIEQNNKIYSFNNCFKQLNISKSELENKTEIFEFYGNKNINDIFKDFNTNSKDMILDSNINNEKIFKLNLNKDIKKINNICIF